MYASIRRTPINPYFVREVAESSRRVLVPMLQKLPGYRSNMLVESAGVVVTVSVFENRASAEESNRMGATWVRENLTRHATALPEIVSTGEVLVVDATEDKAKDAPHTVLEAFNLGYLDRIGRTAADGATYRVVPTGRIFRGPEGYKVAWGFWLTAFPDAVCEITRQIAAGDLCVTEFTLRGTNTGAVEMPEATLPPTGRKVEIPFVSVDRVEGGKLAATDLYFDVATLLRQLGPTPHPAINEIDIA